MKPRPILITAILTSLLGIAVVSRPSTPKRSHLTNEARQRPQRRLHDEPIQPIPTARIKNPLRLALGRDLFHDRRLSRDGTTSCATCHDLQQGGDDGRPVPAGTDGIAGQVNAPTVFNAVHNFRQFWDGRAESLAIQLEGPLFTEAEMGWKDWDSLLEFLETQADLVERFEGVFDDGLTRENLVEALVEFETVLVTPGSAFDRWLTGESLALSTQALEGYSLFKEIGCIACHQGKNVGGNMFQRVRLESSDQAREMEGQHLGRFTVTGQERDRFRFKVPSLRNIELTAPYMHDGSIPDLRSAIQFMASQQLGKDLTEEEVSLLEAFLESLTGEVPVYVGP